MVFNSILRTEAESAFLLRELLADRRVAEVSYARGCKKALSAKVRILFYSQSSSN